VPTIPLFPSHTANRFLSLTPGSEEPDKEAEPGSTGERGESEEDPRSKAWDHSALPKMIWFCVVIVIGLRWDKGSGVGWDGHG
jgi:hypothetical protein